MPDGHPTITTKVQVGDRLVLQELARRENVTLARLVREIIVPAARARLTQGTEAALTARPTQPPDGGP
jgi:hypothetical protein